MLDFLNDIRWGDEKGDYSVPVSHHDMTKSELCDNCGVLPRIDVYQHDKEYEVFAWAENSQQVFQILEQFQARLRERTGLTLFKLKTLSKEHNGFSAKLELNE